MPETSLDINYEIDETSVLINDLAANGNMKAMGTPDTLVRSFLRGLIEEFRAEKSHIVVNTSCMSHIDPLEDVGFTIDEDDSDGHFVSATYDYETTVEAHE